MPSPLISDAHERINEIPTKGTGLGYSAGKKTMLSLTLVRLYEVT